MMGDYNIPNTSDYIEIRNYLQKFGKFGIYLPNKG